MCSLSDPQQIYIGDDNALTLEVSAENQGEGAYEAELHVFPPQQADFTGVVRSQVRPIFYQGQKTNRSLPKDTTILTNIGVLFVHRL